MPTEIELVSIPDWSDIHLGNGASKCNTHGGIRITSDKGIGILLTGIDHGLITIDDPGKTANVIVMAMCQKDKVQLPSVQQGIDIADVRIGLETGTGIDQCDLLLPENQEDIGIE